MILDYVKIKTNVHLIQIVHKKAISAGQIYHATKKKFKTKFKTKFTK